MTDHYLSCVLTSNNVRDWWLHEAIRLIGDYAKEYSHWEAVKSLSSWLEEHNVPGIYGTCHTGDVLYHSFNMVYCNRNRHSSIDKED